LGSLIVHLPKIAYLMLMSDAHVPNFVNRQTVNFFWEKVPSLSQFLDLGWKSVMDASHLDKNRSKIVRSG
jgi:hypothetical protein